MYSLNIICIITLVTFARSQYCNPFQDLCSKLSCPDDSSNFIQLHTNTYLFNQYDVICYGDFSLPDGDVEGRVAVKNNFAASQKKGISVGYGIKSSNGDVDYPYSLIIGQSASWTRGELYPFNNDADTPNEDMFVGGEFTGKDLLKLRVKGNCSNPGCLDQYFDQSQSYYKSLSAYLASQTATATTSQHYGVATISCSASDSSQYFISISASEFSTIIGYEISSNCEPKAIFVFNIVDRASEILFDGNPLTSRVIYNIVEEGQMVLAKSIIYGSILNPQGSINQTSGTIVGSVVAGECPTIAQVNRPFCAQVETSSSSSSGSELTTGNLMFTSGNIVPGEVTSSQLTTSEMTTSETVWGEVTTSELTTSETVWGEVTTSEMTTSYVTTRRRAASIVALQSEEGNNALAVLPCFVTITFLALFL